MPAASRWWSASTAAPAATPLLDQRRRRRRRRPRRAAVDGPSPGRADDDAARRPRAPAAVPLPAPTRGSSSRSASRVEDLPLTETLFAVGNGYLGLRGDHEEGRDANDPGTFINGFHETWSIHHAEQAFGFATTGQTIVNVPDPQDHVAVRRRRAARAGRRRPRCRTSASSTCAAARSVRDLTWRTRRRQARARPLGAAGVARPPPRRGDHASRSRWSSGEAPVVVGSRLLNRQDAEYETRPGTFTESVGVANPERDPRRSPHVQPPRAAAADPHRRRPADGRSATSAPTARCRSPARRGTRSSRRRSSMSTSRSAPTRRPRSVATLAGRGPVAEGHQVRQLPHVALLAPHDGREIVDDAFELATRCTRSLDRVEHDGYDASGVDQEAWLDAVLGEQRRRDASSAAADDGDCRSVRWPRSPSSRRCAGTCSSSPRRRPRSASRASPPRASPAAATRATTSGTRRCTWRRSCRTRGRRRRGS